MYKGILTGKGLSCGGSPARSEATGYDLLYFLDTMLKAARKSIDGKSVVISEAGNAAACACQKAQGLGAKVVCHISDFTVWNLNPDGVLSTI